MIVIGIVGLIGAGKDTAAKYIEEKYGYTPISFSELVHEKVKEEGLEPTRENLQNIAKKYREKYGMDYFAKLAVEKALNSGKDKIILKELRRREDVEYPKRFFKDFYIIEIYANKKIRFKRLKERATKKDPKTWKDFLEQEKKEELLGFHEAIKYSDFKIKNNGRLKELYSKIDKVMKEIETKYKIRRAVEEYNKYRAPEANIEIEKIKDNYVILRFFGPFCKSCGVYDYFEDFIFFLRDLELDGKIKNVKEIKNGFLVKFKIKF
ncbi:MAG: AAA family ATPase [Candidatus Aenigmatarchaeota archaeon]